MDYFTLDNIGSEKFLIIIGNNFGNETNLVNRIIQDNMKSEYILLLVGEIIINDLLYGANKGVRRSIRLLLQEGSDCVGGF